MKNILIINISKEKLHYYEFVKPIEDILKNHGIKYFIKKYNEVNQKDLDKASHVIICGTSLYDNQFIQHIKTFSWIKEIEKPILGICGGMQIIGFLFGGEISKRTEIGFYKENFEKEFFGIIGEPEVYHLHNYYINFGKLKDFEIFSGKEVTQAIKHKEKEIYGTLFHPEVRQKNMIVEFCNI